MKLPWDEGSKLNLIHKKASNLQGWSNRLHDPTSWLALAAVASSRNIFDHPCRLEAFLWIRFNLDPPSTLINSL